MNIRNAIKKTVFRFKYKWLRRQGIMFFNDLLVNQHVSSDELDHINWTKRKRLLMHAYEKSSFYRSKYRQAGIHPLDIRDQAEFEKIPCLTREELRNERERILIQDQRTDRLAKVSTGGSTGVPVQVYADKKTPIETILWRSMSWWGIDPSMDGAFVWRLRRKTGVAQWMNALAWWPTKKIRMDASSMNQEAVHRFIKAYNNLKPPLLQGYTGAIRYLAEEVISNQITVHAPQAVWVTSSPLTTVDRNRIEEAFHAPVYDQYGCCEVPAIAAECAHHKGLHINQDTVHVEFLDPNGHSVPTGQVGDVVLTDLVNEVFPLIRYINGDRGKALPGRCSCGVTLPLMGQVQGRISDRIRLPSGRTLSGEYLTTLFDAFPDSIRQFQVRQQSDYAIRVLFVPNPGFIHLTLVLDKVRQVLEQATQHEVGIFMTSVDSIPHDRGKLKVVVNERN